ncbi:MAG: hypothetical protein ACYTXT_12540 [Nostoc sp.]
MTERLNRIEAILERTAQMAKANMGTIEADRYAIAQLRSTVNSLLQLCNFEAIVTKLREIRLEIRWLRTENQLILEHLFRRQENC